MRQEAVETGDLSGVSDQREGSIGQYGGEPEGIRLVGAKEVDKEYCTRVRRRLGVRKNSEVYS